MEDDTDKQTPASRAGMFADRADALDFIWRVGACAVVTTFVLYGLARWLFRDTPKPAWEEPRRGTEFELHTEPGGTDEVEGFDRSRPRAVP